MKVLGIILLVLMVSSVIARPRRPNYNIKSDQVTQAEKNRQKRIRQLQDQNKRLKDELAQCQKTGKNCQGHSQPKPASCDPQKKEISRLQSLAKSAENKWSEIKSKLTQQIQSLKNAASKQPPPPKHSDQQTIDKLTSTILGWQAKFKEEQTKYLNEGTKYKDRIEQLSQFIKNKTQQVEKLNKKIEKIEKEDKELKELVRNIYALKNK